nr:extracellular matrix protein 2-like [Pongo pygmaeus]
MGLATLQLLPSPPGAPDGQLQPIPGIGHPDKPEAGKLDQLRSQPTPKQGAQGTPTQSPSTGWKAPPRPGLALRKESPPVTSEQEQGHNKGLVTEWAQPQATAAMRAEAGKPGALKLRPWQAGRDPQAQEGAAVTEEDQGQRTGSREDKGRGLKPRRPPKGTSHQPGPRIRRPQKDRSRGRDGGGSTSKTPGRGWKRPGSTHGHRHRHADLGTTQQAMPSLPASCLLAQAVITCGNVKMKHVPALTDPGLTTRYVAENEIVKIPAHTFLGLPNLEWLDLSKNKLDPRGLHPHAFKNLMRLKRLNLDGNSLTTVPALPASLQELKLNDNLLQGLQRSSFRGLSQLLTPEVEGNQLRDRDISPWPSSPSAACSI